MKKILFILAILLAGTLTLEAQSQTVRGIISDTVNLKQLANSSVVLVRKADSVMVAYKRASQDGSFTLNAPAGRYTLLVSCPDFFEYLFVD
jgi:hypothetical protein